MKAQSSVQETYRGSRDGGFRGWPQQLRPHHTHRPRGLGGLLPRSPNAPAAHLVPSPLRSQGPAQADARVAERQECAGLRSSGLGEAQAWETQGRECAAARGRGLERAEAEEIPRITAGAIKVETGVDRAATSVLGFFVAPRATRTSPRGHWPRVWDSGMSVLRRAGSCLGRDIS